MPKGFGGAQKAGKNNYASFREKPKGVNYFAPQKDQVVVVRFLQDHDDIEWQGTWKLPPAGNHLFGESVPRVDQFEDGTPDPGYAANLNKGFRAYAWLIWRNAPVYQVDPAGKLVRDANKNKIVSGYRDRLALWEISNYPTYEQIGGVQEDYRGLMSRDFTIRKTGEKVNTRYAFAPANIDAGATPISQEDLIIAQRERVDLTDWLRIPTYEELNAYLQPAGTAPEPAPSFQQQAATNEAPPLGEQPNPFLAN